MVDTLRTRDLLVCPNCTSYVRPHVIEREYEETGVAADTSGVVATGLRVLTRVGVRCPRGNCDGSWWVGADMLEC